MAMDVISRKLTVYTKTDELMVLVPSTTISVIHVYIFNPRSARTSYIFFQAYTMPFEFKKKFMTKVHQISILAMSILCKYK